MLMFDGPLLACVLVGVDDVAVGKILSGVLVISGLDHALRVRALAHDSRVESVV
jgi:hypothetical protein